MTEFLTDEALVVLTVSPSLEETVIDWLLSRPGGGGFTSVPVSGHSASHGGLSNIEQVTGRRHRVQFQVQMDSGSLEPFLARAREAFGATDTHYWVIPVFSAGRLGTN
jgi:hypothetical protein